MRTMREIYSAPLCDVNRDGLREYFDADADGTFTYVVDDDGIVYAVVVLDTGEVLSMFCGFDWCEVTLGFRRVVQKLCGVEPLRWDVAEARAGLDLGRHYVTPVTP